MECEVCEKSDTFGLLTHRPSAQLGWAEDTEDLVLKPCPITPLTFEFDGPCRIASAVSRNWNIMHFNYIYDHRIEFQLGITTLMSQHIQSVYYREGIRCLKCKCVMRIQTGKVSGLARACNCVQRSRDRRRGAPHVHMYLYRADSKSFLGACLCFVVCVARNIF